MDAFRIVSARLARGAVTGLIAIAMPHAVSAAGACPGAPPPIAAQLSASEGGAVACSHPLCLAFYATDPAHPSRAAAAGAGACSGETLIRRDMAALVAAGGILVLGEVHDNPVHHRLRGILLRQLSGSAPRPGLVLEQLRADQQPEIEAFEALPAEKRSMDALLGAISWDRSGWSKYPYGPLLEAALDGGYPLVAGDGPRDLVRMAARQGVAALTAAERTRLALTTSLGTDQDQAMLREIEDSHCGMLPASALEGMVFSQRVRDAYLADAALQAAVGHRAAVMLIGNGHARTDRGAPWYVRQRDPTRRVAAVLLIEVDEARTDPEAYLPRSPQGTPAADYVIFTPRAERDDPCAEMRRRAPRRQG